MGVIYVATFPNGKKYVGQTSCTLKERISQHKSDAKLRNKNNSIPFYNAINKYGFENIIWDIIDEYSTKEEGNEKEKKWIDQLRTYVHFDDSNGYNATLGGDSRSELTVLNENELIEIGELYLKGYTALELSNKYNVPLWTMQAIFRGERWSDYTKIPPRPEYIPHGSIYSEKEVDQILEKFIEFGNISHVSEWFIDQYDKGSKTSIRSIIKGETWQNYTGIVNDNFYKKYVKMNSKIKNSGIGNGRISLEIANEIREIYKNNNNCKKTLLEIRNLYPEKNITYIMVNKIISNKTWSTCV